MVPRWLKRPIRRMMVACFAWFARRQARRGMDAFQRTGERIGEWHYRLRPVRRARLKRQIARVLGVSPRTGRISRILLDAHRHSDRAVFEATALSVGALEADQLADTVEVSGLQPLTTMLESGRGAVLVGMHMCNALAMLIELSRRGLPVSVVAYQSRKLPDGYFENMFAGTGVETIAARPTSAAYFRCARALKRGRAVFVTMDQIDKRGGIPVRFLDKEVSMPAGPAALARSLRVPVFPVLPLAARPRWTFRIGEAVELGRGSLLEEDVAELTGMLDAHIRAHPDLWSWHHRRWQRYPFIKEPAGRREAAG